VAPVPATLRVGAAIAAGLLVVASTLASPASAAPANIAGMIVFLDPGHNGSNDASIGKQVPTGRGGTKNCQESGTSTDDGYPEHTFTWDTTLRIRQALTALGVRTAMSRGRASTNAPRWPMRWRRTRSSASTATAARRPVAASTCSTRRLR
jgi:N-acetylmuramoyl-L-alanine amidase